MKTKIINNSNFDHAFVDMLKNLTLFAKDRLEIDTLPTIHLKSDIENAKKTLGRTGYYDPSVGEIHIYVDDRHQKDILRSVAHELVHHRQNEKGSLMDKGYHGQGYAQKNPHLRNMEKEAYLKGNMCFRDWEDSYKTTNYSERGNNMSLKEWKNGELNRLLMKKFGLLKEDTNVEEAHCGKRDDGVEELEEEAKPDFPDIDGDGNRNEPITQAAKDKEEADSLEEIIYQEVMKILGGE